MGCGAEVERARALIGVDWNMGVREWERKRSTESMAIYASASLSKRKLPKAVL
jgi:hypothetical protein